MDSSLELGMFLEELATSSSFGDKTISLLMFTPNYRVRAVKACHALRSRAGLHDICRLQMDWITNELLRDT